MTENLDEQIARSLDAQPELLPFLPDLLADVWSLGSSVSIIVELLREGGVAGSGSHVLDAGCGKGAAAVSIAKERGCRVHGIDGFDPFILEAAKRAAEHGVAKLCTFECVDLRKALPHERGYDAVVYAALSPEIFGRHCVESLRECVRPGGYIVIDDGFLIDGIDQKPIGYESLQTHDSTVAALTAHGDRILREVVQTPESWHADDDRIIGLIRKRAEILAAKHPEAAGMFHEYVRTQETECETLRSVHVPASWLLQRTETPTDRPS